VQFSFIQLIRFRVDNVRVFQRDSMNLSMTVFERPQKFFQGGGRNRHFAFLFQIADNSIQMDATKTLYPFYAPKIIPHRCHARKPGRTLPLIFHCWIEQLFVNKYKEIILKCTETPLDRYGMEDLNTARSLNQFQVVLQRDAPFSLYVTFTKTM